MMMRKYDIGIDIGGTNTDAVVIDKQKRIVASYKTLTTKPLRLGLELALKQVMAQAGIDRASIDAIIVGTTHATNALVQRRDLYKVGIIRLAGQLAMLPPVYAWPADLKEACVAAVATVDGGLECDGRISKPLSKSQLQEVCRNFLDAGVQSIAIVGVFSPLYNEQERHARDMIQDILGPQMPITLSSDIGTIGFIERENATAVNAALKKCIEQEFAIFRTICAAQTDAPLYITQNNGSLISVEQACQYPVLTIAAGPTNSVVGGARLAGCSDAIVVDIGGTTTDVGRVAKGFARRSMNASVIGNVADKFSDARYSIHCIGWRKHCFFDNGVVVGPSSCGARFSCDGRAFGGQVLTLTDCAIKLGYAQGLGPITTDIGISQEQALNVYEYVHNKVVRLIDTMKGPYKDLPVVLVGGGAQLFSDTFFDRSSMVPDHCAVANAYGAAVAQISATIDTVVCMDNRDQMIVQLEQEACDRAYECRAQRSTIKMVHKEIIPYSYVPGNKARVIMTAAGDR